MLKEGIRPQPFSEAEMSVIENLIAGIPCKGPDWRIAKANLKQRYQDGSERVPLLLAVADAASCGLVNFDNLPEKPAKELSERHQEIWKFLRQGYAYPQIAEILKTSSSSINSSSYFLFCSLGVSNRFGAVAMRVKIEQRQSQL